MVKQRTRREHQSTRLSDPIREVLAAWIIAVFSLATGLSVLSLYRRDIHGQGMQPSCRAGMRARSSVAKIGTRRTAAPAFAHASASWRQPTTGPV